MAVLIGSARHDENGKLSGGKVGDQLQKIVNGFDRSGEVSVQNYYTHKKGWYCLRPKDLNLANALAFCMAIACNNSNIGYDQSNRLGVYKNGVDTKVKTETDCSGLIRACLKQCGCNVSDFTTANEKDVLISTGLFDLILIKGEGDCYTGDILVTKTKGHTVLVVSGKSRSTKKVNPYIEPLVIQKKGMKGDGVKWCQYELNESGAKLKVDGDFGNKTDEAVRAYQKAHKLSVDGIVGEKTRASLKAN